MKIILILRHVVLSVEPVEAIHKGSGVSVTIKGLLRCRGGGRTARGPALEPWRHEGFASRAVTLLISIGRSDADAHVRRRLERTVCGQWYRVVRSNKATSKS